MAPAVALRVGPLVKYRRKSGLSDDGKLAKAMRMHRITVSRVVSGEMQPGAKFIAGALTAFPDLKFEDLFEVTQKTLA